MSESLRPGQVPSTTPTRPRTASFAFDVRFAWTSNGNEMSKLFAQPAHQDLCSGVGGQKVRMEIASKRATHKSVLFWFTAWT